MSTVPDRLRRWERFAPLSGVVAIVLWIIGTVIVEGATDTPDEDAGAAVFATYYDEEGGTVLAGAFLFMLGSAILLWFFASLRARIHAAEGGVGRIASIVFAAGVVTATMSLGVMAPDAAAAFAAENIDPGLDPGAAQALGVLGDGFFIAAEASLVVFFLAASLATFRTRAIPTWLAWASLVFAVAAVLPWVGWAVVVWGLPLWVLVVGIWMFVRPATPAGPRAEPVVT
jgi:hypothetical protein